MSDYRRLICWFDKKTEILVNNAPLDVDIIELHKIFNQYPDDENLYLAYEIGFEEAEKLDIEFEFDFEKYDYFMEVWSYDY